MRCHPPKKSQLNNIWYPCSQMKDYELFPPIPIALAEGCYFYDAQGHKIIDAISSWWCKTLGHGHPRLKQALLAQLEKFEHVMMPNTTHPIISTLATKLTKLAPWSDHVFFAGDGSCAVEIALKMSLHVRMLEGSKRTQLISLANGYHGETALTLSVSDVGLYKQPYRAFLQDCHHLYPLPYVSGPEDPLWHDCSAYWPNIEKQLLPIAAHATALIVEPIVQGAGGMLIYSPDFLSRLATFAKMHDIHFIADEIMTGLGRTGRLFACDHAKVQPDFMCLSKGLTSGWLPMSVVLTTKNIYQAFYDDFETGKAFLHSHTFSGNPLAASVALETLQILEDEQIITQVPTLERVMHKLMTEIQDSTGKIHRIRGLGGMIAADLIAPANKRVGYEIFKTAVKMGAWLRPLGNTLYWLPPLNIDIKTVEELAYITKKAIVHVFDKK